MKKFKILNEILGGIGPSVSTQKQFWDEGAKIHMKKINQFKAKKKGSMVKTTSRSIPMKGTLKLSTYGKIVNSYSTSKTNKGDKVYIIVTKGKESNPASKMYAKQHKIKPFEFKYVTIIQHVGGDTFAIHKQESTYNRKPSNKR